MNSSEFIHTLQRPKEILAINECYENQDIFVQINIDDDPNKSGININEVDEFFDNFEGFLDLISGYQPYVELGPRSLRH